jgi:hypothetical protein
MKTPPTQEQIADRIIKTMAGLFLAWSAYSLITSPPPLTPLPPTATVADWQELNPWQQLRATGLIMAETQPQSQGVGRNIKTVRLWRCINKMVRAGAAPSRVDDSALLCADDMGWD